MSDPSSLSDRLRTIGAQSGFTLSTLQLAQIEEYLLVLQRWNRKINLTSLSLDGFPQGSLDRLIAEPLRGAALLQAFDGKWLDLGSGGGSPAIPMRVVLPAGMISMVESRSRKAAFLREAARAAEIKGVEIINARIEDLMATMPRDRIDLFSVRALRLDRDIVETLLHLASPRARAILFGPIDCSRLADEFRGVQDAPGIRLLAKGDVPRGT